MNPYWKFRMKPLMVGLAIAVLRFAGPASDDATAGALPKDPCALLKPAEIQAALAPNATIGSGVSDASGLPLGVGCTYSWGPRTKEWGESAITVTVMDVSKAYPGTSPDVIAEGLLAKAKVSGPDASQIPGVGDAAVFTFEKHVSTATAEAFFKAKDIHLVVAYHAGDSLANKDKVIALLKEAATRL